MSSHSSDSQLLSRDSVLCLFSAFPFLYAHTREALLLSLTHTILIPPPSNICTCFLSLKEKIILALRHILSLLKIFSPFPFCLTFLTLDKGGLSLHSFATSELLSFERENVVPVFLCLFWWPVEVPLSCIADFGYASTAGVCCVLGWVLMADPDGIACNRALNWLFHGFCRGSFCGSAMRTISK